VTEYLVFNEIDNFDRRNISQVINNYTVANNLDVFYTTGTSFSIYKREWFGKTKLVTTVHDITPWMLKNIFYDSKEKAEIYKFNCMHLREYDLVFANSDRTKYDVENNLGVKNVFNISMDMDEKEYTDLEVENAWNILNCCEDLRIKNYILFIGGSQINKNLNRTLRAYLHICHQVEEIPKLVIAGRITLKCKDDLIGFIKKHELCDRVLLAESPTDVELVALYRNAYWTVFPSIYEGFGMPVLEAWQQGCPVLTSNNSSLKEIAEGFSIQVDPFSVESIENGLLKALSLNDDERLQYIIKGREHLKSFSWEKTAREALRLMGEVCGV
jgi:glycosyltransferase involved in cell wall biosynthesis